MTPTHLTTHHTAHLVSEGTQSAVRIVRMLGRQPMGLGLEAVPFRRHDRPRFASLRSSPDAARLRRFNGAV